MTPLVDLASEKRLISLISCFVSTGINQNAPVVRILGGEGPVVGNPTSGGFSPKEGEWQIMWNNLEWSKSEFAIANALVVWRIGQSWVLKYIFSKLPEFGSHGKKLRYQLGMGNSNLDLWELSCWNGPHLLFFCCTSMPPADNNVDHGWLMVKFNMCSGKHN